MSRPPVRRVTAASSGSGFSLVLSLTLMAMLLLLCLGATALLAVELRVSRATASAAIARMNALAGARIALGEIQRTLGPDQRVSATAEILCDATQTDPTQPAYYTHATDGRVVHPRWVGVWNSGRANDVPGAVPGAAPGETTKVLRRTGDGYLMDSRFANGGDWAKDRASKSPAVASKRFVGWLVSGNEALPGSATDSLTPFSPVATAARNDRYGRLEDVSLLDRGTLGTTLPGPWNRNDGDYLGARVARVAIPGVSGSEGAYAYWVADEGVKARLNIRDRFEAAGLAPSSSAPANGGYARLMLPQRNNFDRVKSPVPGAPALPPVSFSGAAGKAWDLAGSFEDLPVIDNPSTPGASAYTPEKLRPYYYHDLSFTAAGVAANVVDGGLKKDLSAFLDGAAGADIADYAGVPGSGLYSGAGVVGEPTLTKISPKFELFRTWWRNAAAYAGTSETPVAPTGFNQLFTLVANPHNQARLSADHAPFTLKLPDFSKQTQGALAPVVTDFSINHQFAAQQTSGTAGFARTKVWVRVALWNPYAVPLRLEGVRLEYLNDLYVYYNLTGAPAPYVYYRPHITFPIPALVLQPGQSVMLVADKSKIPMPSGNPSVAATFGPLTVPLKESGPAQSDHFYDYILSSNPSGALTLPAKWPNPDQASVAITCKLCLAGPFSPATFDQTKLNIQQMLVTDATGAVLQQVNLNPYFGNTYAGEPYTAAYQYRPVGNAGTYSIPAASIDTVAGANTPADLTADQHYGFRLKFIDGTDSTDTGVAGMRRNLEFAPVVDSNPRSPRPSRTPFDVVDKLSPANVLFAGIWTNRPSDPYVDNTWTPSVASPRRLSPFISAVPNASPTYPGCLLYDVPFRETGILSLGQLRHAAMNALPYGPSIPFGSSRIPAPAEGGDLGTGMTDRSGVKTAEMNKAWSRLLWNGVGDQLRQQNNPGGTGVGAGTHDIYDIAFEQNNALWDAFAVSGINAANGGRGVGKLRWDAGEPGVAPAAKVLPNSRFAPVYAKFPSGGYFNDGNFELYKASYTLLTKGTFNVNSTSAVAWKSLLAAFRGIRVPTREVPGGAGAANLTPYPRVLRPKSDVAKNSGSSDASFDEESWSGFRALTDDELDRLAEKIVAEVKLRGPFLGLSDFVNRRLRTPSSGDLAGWETKEKNYLGTIDGAILAAGLNAQFAKSAMDRVAADYDYSGSGAGAAFTPRKPQFRAKHKVAGIPGYLEQGDILQPLGAVLAARSDTFTIRSRGESADGAVAFVELTVQRLPEPLLPSGGTGVLPVNPRASTDPDHAGNQLFGRRFKVVALRWMNPSEA